MFYLIQTYWWVFLLALLIGFVTGWWAWAHSRVNLSSATGAMSGAVGTVGGMAAGATASVTGAAGAALDKAKAAAETVADSTKAVAGGVLDSAQGVVEKATDAASNLASGATSAAAATLGAAGTVAVGAVDAAHGAADAAAGAVVVGVAALSKPRIAAAVGAPDDLLKIKGIGPKLNTLCNSLGVTRFDQIAKWGAQDVAEVDQHLGTFRGRIARDGWIEQAGLLAAGNIAAFEAKFGKLDSENK